MGAGSYIYRGVATNSMEKTMTIDTNKVRAAETTPHHVVLKMLVVSTVLATAALALAVALI
jgi:hypothetical protein